MAASRPASSCQATSTHQPTSSGSGHRHARLPGGRRIEQARVAGEAVRRGAQHVGARRCAEALERARLTPQQAGASGSRRSARSARLATGEGVVGQGGLHEVVQRSQALHLPALASLAAERAEQVEGPRLLRCVEVGGELQDPLLGEGARLVRGRPEEVAVVDEVAHELHVGGLEVEPPQEDVRPCAPGRARPRGPRRGTRRGAAGPRCSSARTSIESGSSSSRRRSRSITCSRWLLEPSSETLSPSPAPEGRGQLGQRSVEHARGLEEPPGALVAPLDHVEQRGGEPGRPTRSSAGTASESQSSSVGVRSAARQEDRRVEGQRHRQLVGRPSREPDIVRARPSAIHPPAAGCRSACPRASPPRAGVVPELEELRGDERRDEHDEEEGGVEVVAQHAVLQPDGGEDQPDLAARQHAEADERLVARRADRAQRREQLARPPRRRGGWRRRGAPQPLAKAVMSASMPIWRKKTGMKR